MIATRIEAEQTLYCAGIARQGDGPVLGTATQVRVWLLLEYRRPWRARAETDNDLPDEVQDYLAQQLAAVSDSRLLFIRQQKPYPAELKLFIIRTDESEPQLYAFQLEAYEDILTLDIEAVARGDESHAGHRRDGPLFLVCTNGKRDKCCAKWGAGAYQTLRETNGDKVWQSSHIGGHRYAPNVLFLPHSVNYGLLEQEDIQRAADAYLNGKLYDLDRYRGRTYHAPQVQTADYYLRRHLQYDDLSGLRLISADEGPENLWAVRFGLASGEIYQVKIRQALPDDEQLVSCSPLAWKQKPRYRLVKNGIDRV